MPRLLSSPFGLCKFENTSLYLVYYTLSACFGLSSHLSRIRCILRHRRSGRILTNMINYTFRRRPRGALRQTIYAPTAPVAVLTLPTFITPANPTSNLDRTHVYTVTGNNKSKTYTRVVRDVFIVLHTSDGCVCVCVYVL